MTIQFPHTNTNHNHCINPYYSHSITNALHWTAGLYKFDRLYSKIFESPTVMAKEIRGDTTSASTTTNYGNDCLPGLENEKTETINPKYHQQNLHSTGTINYDSKELPPAFISENDYPKGWLVYHPEHKVINLEKLLQEISGAEY